MKNIKVGDVGFAYCNLKMKQSDIQKGLICIERLNEILDNEYYPYKVIISHKHFFSIDLSKPLRDEIDRFLNLKSEES